MGKSARLRPRSAPNPAALPPGYRADGWGIALMRTIVHMSDLHFGRVDDALLTPLWRAINEIAPDVVVVSGGLTQRARSSQFLPVFSFWEAANDPKQPFAKCLSQLIFCSPTNRKPTPGSVAIQDGEAALSPSFCLSLPTSTRK